ncbi:type II toxin-antitoxin system RelE/ParE family toxin [Aequorivita echinoideorum]|uniref:Type II toxin-antitoxin system RelE/ParE family toxin n=1 Tax=Aequorivita echinoideorum TaxID=1549647 RepID=A0ABS5S0P8_9FLAO|nr:type II toxin-antitoxin system RelE/ParE family toxin [Aequorivita echinoideorum]MBT0606787.1 type II toxin-antitoxin system RelE/ParE family toxin [Aequorivita echinoideorum]
MDFDIVFSKEADIEFYIIDCFLGAKGINEKFHLDFHEQMQHIKANPFQFQLRYKDVRMVHLKKFNYSIHYCVFDKTITVLRILNQKQAF